MISPNHRHDHSYSAIHSSKRSRPARPTRTPFSTHKKLSFNGSALPPKRLTLKSPKHGLILVEDENHSANGAPASPPPPPPPLLDFDTCARSSRRNLSNLDVSDSTGEEEDCGGDLSQALLRTGYIERISKQAREYRKLKETKQSGGAVESKGLKATVERLRSELKKKEIAEARLLDVNRRLQERLKLFQKQNQENVATAKAQINALKKHRRRPHQSPETAEDVSTEKIKRVRLKSVVRAHFVAWYRLGRLQRFARISRRRRMYELKARMLREWACNTIILKICTRAIERRLCKMAKRCLRSWEEYVWIVHAKKRAIARADDYRIYILNYRRCFQDWKRFTARSKANGQRVEQLLHSSLKLCHRDRLRHYFSVWNAARIHGKQQTTVLLMRVFSTWKTELIRTRKQKIKESELAILSLAQLGQSQLHCSSDPFPPNLEQEQHERSKTPAVVSNIHQPTDHADDAIHSASFSFS